MVLDINDLTIEELRDLYLKDRKHNLEKINELKKENEKLQKKIDDDEININDLKLQLEVEHAKYMQVVSAKYQSQKNQIVLDMPTLFNDIEEEALKIEDKQTEEVITVSEYTKKKRTVKEKHIDYSSLERKVVEQHFRRQYIRQINFIKFYYL